MKTQSHRCLAAVGCVCAAAAVASLAGCFPPVPPVGDLGGAQDAGSATATVSPNIYVIGPGATLTVGVHAPPSGADTDEHPERARPEAPPPAEQTSGATTDVREPSMPGDAPRPAVAAGRGEPLSDLAQTLREAEGFSASPYAGPNGVPHIGYGHRLTHAEADALLAQDIADARAAAQRVVGEPTWSGLTERRRDVLAEMAYMAGPTGLGRFRKMLEAVRAGDYDRAADEITASLLRPPARAGRLATAMREG